MGNTVLPLRAERHTAMSKTGSGKASKGSSSKGSSANEKLMLSKTQAMKTPAEYRACLRKALFNDDGTDKDCTKGLQAFMSLAPGGVELDIRFFPAKKLWKKSKAVAEYCFELAAAQMEDEYDNSGYGWDDGDKMDEMQDKSTRYLIVMRDGKPCGFLHFGFTLQ